MDVDVLIEIEPDVPFSLIDLVGLKEFLEDRLDRPVDVVTKAGLEPSIRGSRASRGGKCVLVEQDPGVYVRHILEAIANIEADTAGFDFEKFRMDRPYTATG